jgi:hypothetical protein
MLLWTGLKVLSTIRVQNWTSSPVENHRLEKNPPASLADPILSLDPKTPP